MARCILFLIRALVVIAAWPPSIAFPNHIRQPSSDSSTGDGAFCIGKASGDRVSRCLLGFYIIFCDGRKFRIGKRMWSLHLGPFTDEELHAAGGKMLGSKLILDAGDDVGLLMRRIKENRAGEPYCDELNY